MFIQFSKTLPFITQKIDIKSAGTEAHGLNPYTVHTMNEVGIDISHHKSKKNHYFSLQQ